jgi:hypothetical protein
MSENYQSELTALCSKVDKHLQNELDIMEIIFQLPNSDIEAFYTWYSDNPKRRGIEEIQNVVRGRTDKETNAVCNQRK